MIRKVPNMPAWIGKLRDFHILRSCSPKFIWMVFELPVFKNKISLYYIKEAQELDLNSIALFSYINLSVRDLNLDDINNINKIWNEFMEIKEHDCCL